MNFSETNPRAAAQQYLRAMNHWRNAFRKHMKDDPGVLEAFESEPEETAQPQMLYMGP